MGSLTENYNLYKPDNNETGWGDEVNNNFDIIDSKLYEILQSINNLQTQINSMNSTINNLSATVNNILNVELPKKIEKIPTKIFSSGSYHCLYGVSSGNYINASLTLNRLYIIPFYTFEECKIVNIGIQVPSNVNGQITAKIGIYKSTSASRIPTNAPLQASVTVTVPANNVGIFVQAINYELEKSSVYYYGLTVSCSVSTNILHVNPASMIQFIPKITNDTAFPTYYYVESVSNLPATLPTSYSAAIGLNTPVVLTSISSI